MWSPFLASCVPWLSFLTELCPGIHFCALVGFLPELIIPLVKEHVASNLASKLLRLSGFEARDHMSNI